MIGVCNLSKAFGAQQLFADVGLQLDAGCRYGVVGANGSGKSTFLKALSGEEPASGGEVTWPKNARIGVLRQDQFVNDDQSILQVAMMGDEVVWQALQAQDQIEHQSDPDPLCIAELDETINAFDGYTLESRACQVLVGLGLQEQQLRNPLRTLSGGYRLRVLLAQVLVGRPDAVLLDEPTNHLDILSIRWLERFLARFRGCAVVVSHDHRFLNNVATHILDVDYGTIAPYPGNYEAFVRLKAATRERQETAIARAEKVIAEKKAFIERFKAKATKARQAQSRVKQVERIEVEQLAPSSRRYPRFSFGIVRPSGRDVLRLEQLCKAYGEHRVLQDVSLSVRRGERVAVIGANGLGKSTLLKILADQLAATSGQVIWGHEAQPGYFAQDQRELLPDDRQSVLDYLWEICPQEGTGFVRGMLGRVLFSGDDVEKKVGALSGGEASRLVLSRLMVRKPNVMLLDEPTNHLDLESIEALVAALSEYQGTLVFVSHDRWFVSRLATRVIELQRDGLNDFLGTYDEYLAQQGEDFLDAEQQELRAKKQRRQRAKPRQRPEASKGSARAVERERDEVLSRIQDVEGQLSAIQRRYCEPDFFQTANTEQVEQLRSQEAELNREQERLMQQWEQLEARLGG